MTYLIRYAIAESNFMKLLILRHSVAYGIPNLNSLQFNLCGFLQGKKVCTRPVPLYLPVQLPDVVCHRQQGYLCLHILIPTAQETPEPCVLLQVPKSPLHLDAAVHPQFAALFTGNTLQVSFPRCLKLFGYLHALVPFFQWLLAVVPLYALFFILDIS